jgi:hypothetical protein
VVVVGVEEAAAVAGAGVGAGGAAAGVVVTGGLVRIGVTSSGLRGVEAEDVVAARVRVWCAGGGDFTSGLERVGAGIDADVVVGANPEVTDSGSPARPMGVAAS